MRHPHHPLVRLRLFLRRMDWPLVPIVLMIMAVGVAVQWSVAGPESFPTGHLMRLGMAGFAALVAVMIPARWWRENAYLLYGGCIFLLVLVLLIGRATNNARRWIHFTESFKLQPSEFTKLALILTLAKWFGDRGPPRRLEELVVPAALALLPAALILAEPDLGTALTFAPIFLTMAFLAGAQARTLAILILIPLLLSPIAFLGLREYQLERVTTWWNQDNLTAEQKSDAGYHLWHAKLAIGGGGFTGHGWAQGPENRLGRLPERHNDFIFPVIAEEYGFIGATGFLALYALLPLAAWIFASRYRWSYTRMLIAGVGMHFAVHLLVNVGVTLGVMPTTGLPLPMVSWGGSSMLVSGMLLGVVLSAGAEREPLWLAQRRRS